MSSGRMSVAQAATFLGVHPQRVHQRIREGSLPAEKVGNQWIIDTLDLHRIRHRSRPGRPLSPKSAWDMVAVALGDPAASALSASARSRARSRVRDLIAQASSADLDDAVALLEHALGNRAERGLFVASVRDLPDVRDDERVHLSGVSRPESNMSAGDVVEGYVAHSDLESLIEAYLLTPAPRSRANVILHVVPDSAAHPALSVLEALAGSALVLAADLAEQDGVREHREAIRLLAGLQSTLVVPRRSGEGHV